MISKNILRKNEKLNLQEGKVRMIKFRLQDEIAFITLNRPEKRNAIHPDMANDIISKLDEIKNDASVKVLVITGEGKSFCAGADLEYLKSLNDKSIRENEIDTENLAKMFLSIYNFPKPVIAAVNGAAIAGGCGLASVCDFIVADKVHSKFGYTEVKIGFIPAIVSIFLIKKSGQSIAKKLLLTGDIIDSKKAFEYGIVDYLADDAMKESIELANRLKQNSSLSMEMTKDMIHLISNFNVAEAVDYCIRLNTISRTSEDFQRGINNFLTK